MRNEEKIIDDNDNNKESNRRVRQDWQNFKKIILNRNYLIYFIAVSVVVIDIMIVIGFASDSGTKTGSVEPETISTPTKEILIEHSDGSSSDTSNKKCNVVGINLHGALITYIPKEDYNDSSELNVDETSSEDIYSIVKSAENDETIKAIMVEIDSPGGEPVAAEEVERTLKASTKPVIVYIRTMGASAAYWAATGADRIFALPSSQVGSIAVNSSYLDEVKLNQKDGYTFNDLSTGKYKNIMNNNKVLTEDERALIMKDLYATHDVFVKTVAENRKLDINKVKEIANGWAYTGTEALSMGLIDELGGLDDVKNYIKSNILNNEEADICW